MNEIELTEKYVIDKVLSAEKSAEESYLVELDFDLFKIEKSAVDDDDFKRKASIFFDEQTEIYDKIRNVYKEADLQFDWLNSAAKGIMNQDSRFSFIAQVFCGFLHGLNGSANKKDANSLEISINVVEQLQNLEQIVFDTHLAKLRSEYCQNKIRDIKAELKAKNKSNEHTEEVNPYPSIFKNNGYEIWKYMFEAFKIDNKNKRRTHARFMMEVLKRDGYMHTTIGEKQYRDFINREFEIYLDKLPFVNPKDNAHNEKNVIYNQAKLYKSN